MTWTNKTKEDIRDAILQIAAEETGLSSFKEGGVLRGLIETLTETTYSLYSDSINFYSGQFTYMQASGLLLDLRGRELGVLRKEAQKTKGIIKVKANSTKAAAIPKGTWFITHSDLRYKTTRDISLNEGVNDVPVEAEFPGALYNILAGSTIRTTSVLDGVNEITVSNNWITTPGRDRELDEDYRQRIKAKWDSQGTDNRPGKYEHIALAVPGVDDVRVIRAPRGFGSIDVVIAGYAETPTSSVISQVRQRLADSYLLTRDIIVRAAAETSQDFELRFFGNADVSSVRNALRAWLQRRKIGQTLTMKELYQEALSSLDISKLEYISPRQDIKVAPYAKVTPGEISVNKEP